MNQELLSVREVLETFKNSNRVIITVFDALKLLAEQQCEIEAYKKYYENMDHYNDWGCEFPTFIDGVCVSCERKAPRPLNLRKEKEQTV